VCEPSEAPAICTVQRPDTVAVPVPRTVVPSRIVTVLPAVAVPERLTVELATQLFCCGAVISGGSGAGATTVKTCVAGVGSALPA
jgi:hypothetical protein